MKTLKVSDIPTFAGWVAESTTPDDNMLNGYIKELQDDISGLVMIEDYFSPEPDGEPSEEYTAINTCARRMAHLVADLKSIRREVRAAKLLAEAGLNPKKGGEK